MLEGGWFVYRFVLGQSIVEKKLLRFESCPRRSSAQPDEGEWFVYMYVLEERSASVKTEAIDA